jgi:DNA-binding CsgD family transcriptional regulator
LARPSGVGKVRVFYAGADSSVPAAIEACGLAWVDRKEDAELVLSPVGSGTAPEARGANGLTAREAEVLEYLADGWNFFEIADRLGISPATVKFHAGGIYRKFGVNRRAEAVREGSRRGMIEW